MIGQRVGHYRIEEKLGAGGMGVVYRARDERLGRAVALKVLPAEKQADETARARLLREARAASSLNHPHICHIYEVGEADGQTYIAMELVEGQPLSARVPAEGLPVEAVLRYGAQIADALAHAHERGIVHRDLKTANVVITPEGRAKVLDFGLAKQMEEELQGATRSKAPLTQEGAVAGTLHYMAPEVLRGEPADARSDLWALGVVLYEMACGKLPFEGKTGYELSSAILHQSPAALPPRAPAGLRAIVTRCLAKEPGERYQRASEVRAALEALQSDTSVAAVTPPRTARPIPLWAIVGGAALILAAILGSVMKDELAAWFGLAKQAGQSTPRLSTGGKPSPNAEANEYFERGLLFFAKQYDPERAQQMLSRALELDPKFAEARAWSAFLSVLQFGSRSPADTSVLYQAEGELRRALEDDPHCGRAHSARAALYFYLGRKHEVPEAVEKALAANPDDIEARCWLVNYHHLNGEYTAAEALVQQVLEVDPLFWVAHLNYAGLKNHLGDAGGAERELEKVLEQDPRNPYALRARAQLLMERGDLAGARASLEKLAPAHRAHHPTRLKRALLLALEGRPAEARQEMDEDVLTYAGVDPFATAGVAQVYAALGEKGKALEWLERAVRNGDERAQWFERDPLLANLRNEPRFRQILDSIAFRRQSRLNQDAQAPAR